MTLSKYKRIVNLITEKSLIFPAMKKQTKKEAQVKVDKTMRDYSKEEFFVKKMEKAREIFKKYGVPKDLITTK
jgi:iron-sulfur cluster repair protein YtfE (RIC family)